MQTNNMVINHEMESFLSKGSTDAKLGQEVSLDKGVIKPAARWVYSEIKARYAGSAEQAKMKYEQVEKKVKRLRSGIEKVMAELKTKKVMSFFKLFSYYTLPGWIFVVGDIMFSKELIVKGWELGNSSTFEKYSLAIAIGLAPFFVKHIVDRFIEPNLENGTARIKRFITGSYIFTGLGMIFCFCWIAYVRYIFFQFTKTSTASGKNVYDILLDNYGIEVALSFILIALMFVIGGGVLLSFSASENAKRKDYKALKKSLKSMNAELEIKTEQLPELRCKDIEAKEILSSWSNKEECLDHIEGKLKYAYLNGFHNELVNIGEKNNKNGSIDKITGSTNNFHDYTRQLVDQYSMDKKASEYNA